MFINILNYYSQIIDESLFDNQSNVSSNISLVLKLFGTYYLLNKSISGIPKIKSLIYKKIKQNSYVNNYITTKINEVKLDIKKDLNQNIKDEKLYLDIPTENVNPEDILNLINNYNQKELGLINSGKVSGCIYHNNDKLDSFMNQVFPIYYRSNPLHPDIYPFVRKMEAEIVQMCASLMNSIEPSAGSFTSGGTESILLACKTYRDIAIEKGITKPEIIVASNAHAAYWKAGHYFNIKIIELDSYFDDIKDMFNTKKLESKLNKVINNNTIAIIASAPSFNHGIVDPIYTISDIAFKKKLYLHIDYCLGGFLLPFLDNESPDFRLLGVSSISLDTHKYGNGPKGGSVILYSSTKLYKKQAFVKDDWSGGIYGTSNLSGSRDGNAIVLTWATLMYHGFKKYNSNAINIKYLTLKLRSDLENIEEIFIYGKPETCIVGVGSDKFNIYLLTDKLVELGWNINILQNPSSFHFCITNNHNADTINNLVEDIKKCIQEILMSKKNDQKQEVKSIYGTTQKINDPEIIGDVVREYMCCLNELK
jgi:sphinganine-1-phosphate aldolase